MTAHERRKTRWRAWAAWIAVGLVLYALSPGPVWWIYNRLALAGYSVNGASTVIGALYWPLQQVVEALPPVRQFYYWYTGLFAIQD